MEKKLFGLIALCCLSLPLLADKENLLNERERTKPSTNKLLSANISLQAGVPVMTHVGAGPLYYCPPGGGWAIQRINWSALSIGTIIEYQAEVKQGSVFWQSLYQGPDTGVSYNNFYALGPTHVRVRARNAEGWSAYISTTLTTPTCPFD